MWRLPRQPARVFLTTDALVHGLNNSTYEPRILEGKPNLNAKALLRLR